MSRLGALVKPIQEGIVIDIDKELRPSRLWATGVGHRKCTGSIGNTLVVLADFIGNIPSSIAFVGISITGLKRRPWFRATRPGLGRVGVLGVWAS